jgi:hypothetical protein
MFFGCLAGGRWGGLAAGMGFVLLGFLLMLVASYVYVVVKPFIIFLMLVIERKLFI